MGATSDIQTQLSAVNTAVACADGTGIYMVPSSANFTINISGCSKGYISATEGIVKIQMSYPSYSSYGNTDYTYYTSSFILSYNTSTNAILAVGAGFSDLSTNCLSMQSTCYGGTYPLARVYNAAFVDPVRCTVSGTLSSANFNIYQIW